MLSTLNFILFIWMVYPSKSAFPPSLRYPSQKITLNKIDQIQAKCDSQNLNITLTTKQYFKGILFAKDFAQECKTYGTSSKNLFISLPTSGCGVRLTTSSYDNGTAKMQYSINLILQQDRFLRQISDQETVVHCKINDEAFLVKSPSLFNVLKNDIKRKDVNYRVGRLMQEGWSRDLNEQELEEELQEAMSAARAWMEISPENLEKRSIDTVEVGETVLLTVKSTLPVGIGWRIVDCVAHDGLGYSSQKLLDDLGCPIDENLLPAPKFGPMRHIASMRLQEAVAKFAAFKFPDRDRLHLRCRLQLCRGACAKNDCDNNLNSTTENRIGRSNSGEILDKFEVYNSVEVIAPEIDDANDFKKKIKSAEFDTYPFPKIPGDKTFCVSVDKMAISFCILGIIFIIAASIAACALLARRYNSQNENQHYTRSLFSSSSSGSAFGSKLLIQESPIFGNSSSSTSASNRMQYGRIL